MARTSKPSTSSSPEKPELEQDTLDTLDAFASIKGDAEEIMKSVLMAENPDTPERKKAARDYNKNKAYIDESVGDEAQIDRFDFVGMDFFIQGIVASASIGRIDTDSGIPYGTGFLVAPDIIMTNKHVIRDIDDAKQKNIGFEVYDKSSFRSEFFYCRFDPERFSFFRDDFDVAIIAIEQTDETRRILPQLGYHPVVRQTGKINLGEAINIVQYPEQLAKSVVVHNSTLIHLQDGGPDDRYLWYTSDTRPGSSGSPVFNRNWEMVGLHHRSVPKLTEDRTQYIDKQGNTFTREEALADPSRVVVLANQAIRASRIVMALQESVDKKIYTTPMQAEVAKRLLAIWERSTMRNEGQHEVFKAAKMRFIEAQRLLDAPANPVSGNPPPLMVDGMNENRTPIGGRNPKLGNDHVTVSDNSLATTKSGLPITITLNIQNA